MSGEALSMGVGKAEEMNRDACKLALAELRR